MAAVNDDDHVGDGVNQRSEISKLMAKAKNNVMAMAIMAAWRNQDQRSQWRQREALHQRLMAIIMKISIINKMAAYSNQ
jgi:hypothetical protein